MINCLRREAAFTIILSARPFNNWLDLSLHGELVFFTENKGQKIFLCHNEVLLIAASGYEDHSRQGFMKEVLMSRCKQAVSLLNLTYVDLRQTL